MPSHLAVRPIQRLILPCCPEELLSSPSVLTPDPVSHSFSLLLTEYFDFSYFSWKTVSRTILHSSKIIRLDKLQKTPSRSLRTGTAVRNTLGLYMNLKTTTLSSVQCVHPEEKCLPFPQSLLKFLVGFLFLFCFNKVIPCDPGWPGTCSVDQAVLEFSEC